MLLAFTVCGVFDRVALKALANAGTFTLFHRLRLFLSEGLSLRLRHGGSHAHLDLQYLIAAAKERYERLCRELLQLQQERELAMGQEILNAMKKSGKSYREIMTFLGSP